METSSFFLATEGDLAVSLHPPSRESRIACQPTPAPISAVLFSIVSPFRALALPVPISRPMVFFACSMW